MNPLTPDQALQLLDDAAQTIHSNRQTHIQLILATTILKGVIEENQKLKGPPAPPALVPEIKPGQNS